MPAELAAEALLRELGGMWRSLEQAEGEAAVLRACSMTLLIVTEGGGDCAFLGETLAPLMREHPSRAIIVDLRDEDTPLEARVSVQCWLPFGRRRQVCSERIEIAAGRGALVSLAPVLRALLVPDLPAVLWVRQPYFAVSASAAEILELAGKVIVDTAALPDARSALAEMTSLGRRVQRAADLSWTRLTRWRETVAWSLEASGKWDRISRVNELVIAHSGGVPGVPAYYMAAWLAGALGWDGGAAGRARIRFVPAQAECSPGVAGIRLRGGGFDFSLRRGRGPCAELELDGSGSRVVIEERPLEELLREELSLLETDAVFEDTLKRAVDIAAD